jgi:hypothetical protein
MMAHTYLSTACSHNRHDQCRERCKFCQVACICGCHIAPKKVDEEPVREEPKSKQ